MADSNSYPIVAFYYKVSFQFSPQHSIDTTFQAINGLKSTIETETYAEGGQNWFKHQLPLRASYQDLILKRHLVNESSALTTWCQQAIEEFIYVPVNITISILNEKAEVLRSWIVTHAIPNAYELSELNAEESKLMMETITLKYQYFKEIKSN